MNLKIYYLNFIFLLASLNANSQDLCWVKKPIDRDIINKSIYFSTFLKSYCIPCDSISSLNNHRSIEKLRYASKPYQLEDSAAFGTNFIGLDMLGLTTYHELGFTGKGITIALFDAGFPGIDTALGFKHFWNNNRIVAYKNFHSDYPQKDSFFNVKSGHGTAVLSIAGANYSPNYIGAAPDANFVLARTEVAEFEKNIEELYWVQALEWADSIGVDIIHSSLGYSLFDSAQKSYTYLDMNGENSTITKATNIATERGIFVTNSAGNSGNEPWRFITAPCDGYEVLCVGALDSFKTRAPFSSIGPSSDGRIKPEVMAFGRRNHYIAKDGKIKQGSGTSFSGPLVAGMVACLKQAFPEANNNLIREAIIKSADRYSMPDSFYGYGIPNVLIADSIIRKKLGLEPLNLLPKKLSIYPNPVIDFLNISEWESIQSMQLFHSNGQLISSYKQGYFQNTIDLRHLNQGIYYLKILSNNGNKWFPAIRKIIKIN